MHISGGAFPEIFNWLQDKGAVDDAEMLRTFNCGIGMVLIVAKGDQQAAVNTLETQTNESG